jgi:hypothetical protein
MADSTAEPQIFRFRDAIRELSPWWLRQGIALRFLYTIGLHLDTLVRMAQEAVRRRFPGLDSDDSIPLIGRERRITRGRAEPTAIYASRLARWLTDHRLRGGPYAMLAQLYAHFAAAPFAIELRYYSGRRFEMDTAGAIVRGDVAWLPDARSDNPCRWWLFYDWPTVVFDDGGWGDVGTWGDGGTWGTNLSVEEVEDIRIVPRQWNAGHITKGRIVLSEGSTELWGAPGDWGDPGWWGAENYAAIDVQ